MDVDDIHDDAPSFDYSSLAQQEIRLLKIDCTSTGEMICEISIYSLPSAPPYSALSYTWGINSPTQYLKVIQPDRTRYRVPLTNNLAAALQSLCRYQSAGELLHLWVDSICIDQSNLHEKSHQVALMSTIYASSARVLIWLGLAEDDSDLAMDSLLDLHQRLSTMEKAPFVRSQESFSQRELPDFAGPVWPALAALSRRAWFTRLWVVQEAALAPRGVLICGQRSMDWHLFCRATDDMIKTGLTDHMLRNTERVVDDGFRSVGYFIDIRDIRSLTTLWMIGSRKECIEPVDRIYGMLGLMTTTTRETIPVDYEFVKKEGHAFVYMAAAKHIFAQERDLSLLSMVSSMGKDPDLPSWCPSFSPRHKMNPLFRVYNAGMVTAPLRNEGEDAIVYVQDFCFPRFKYDFMVEHGTRREVLGICGVQVDTIKYVMEDISWPRAPTMQSMDGPGNGASKIIEWMEETAQLSRDLYRNASNTVADE